MYVPQRETDNACELPLLARGHLQVPQDWHWQGHDQSIEHSVDDGNRDDLSVKIAARSSSDLLVPIKGQRPTYGESGDDVAKPEGGA